MNIRNLTLPKITIQTIERIALVVFAAGAAYLYGRLESNDSKLHADTTANSNNRMIAVTGPYQQGVALLYVIDTESKQLAIYEARGGSRSSGRINFVGARRIDLDLHLEGYHDDSEFSYADLAAQFKRSGWADPTRELSTGEKTNAETPADTKKPSIK
ncbi:MAG: hypothetical protein ACKVS6_07760 [Planctomycetota bacterium]